MVDLIYNTEVSSTNDLAMASNKEWQLFMAETQTAGRGQRGNSWESEPGVNLTFSLLLTPTFLHASMQFYLSKIVSLAIVYAIEDSGLECKIKWPNDIYYQNRKICGILIENVLSPSAFIQKCVVGVGINVNQQKFFSSAPNPTSLAIELGESTARHALLNDFLLHIYKLYQRLKEEDYNYIDTEYINYLYKYRESGQYRDAQGEFVGVIQSVKPQGELIIQKESGESCSYLFKQVEFLL